MGDTEMGLNIGGGVRRPSHLDTWGASTDEERQSLSPKISDVQKKNMAIQAEKDQKTHLRRTLAVIFLVFLGVVGHLTAQFTLYWYVSESTQNSQTAEGDLMVREQVVAVSMTGVLVTQDFCLRENRGSCIADMDQFRHYDDAKNDQALQWPNINNGEHYVQPVQDARDGAHIFAQCIFFVFVCMGLTVLIMLIGIANHKCSAVPRCVYLCVAGTHFLGLGVMFASIYAFVTGTSSLRDILEEYPLIPFAEPELKPGYSFILAGAAMAAYLLAFIPFFLAIPPPLESDGRTRKMAERDRRVSSYFLDLANTSHARESNPVDTAAGRGAMNDLKPAGWTMTVQSTPINEFTTPDKNARLKRDPETGDAVGEEAAFSGSLEWRKKKKPDRRATLSETPIRSPLPGAVDDGGPTSPQRRAAQRRATMTEGVPQSQGPAQSRVVPVPGGFQQGLGTGLRPRDASPPPSSLLPSMGDTPGGTSPMRSRNRKVTRAPAPPKDREPNLRPKTPPGQERQTAAMRLAGGATNHALPANMAASAAF